jgi:peptidyl-prolyl cis-trans isomerase SurA
MHGKQARIGAALLAAALVLFTSGPSGAQPAPRQGQQAAKPAAKPAPVRGEGIAAVVNDEVISTLDVRQRSALILASSGIQPTAETMQQVRSQALRGLIDENIQLQEAKAREIEPREADVDSGVQRIAQSNNLTLAQLNKQLVDSGASMATLRRQLRAEITWRRLISARYGSRVRISSEEINDTLERIKDNASKPQYRLGEILLLADTDKEVDEAMKVADRLLREMRAGRVSFAAVARQFSGAPSAAAGGDLGWLSEGELRPELVAATRSLRVGQVSSPLRTEFGVLIIALRELRDGVDASRAMKVRLRQVSAPVSSRAALDRAKARIRGCDSIANAIKNVPDARVVDLGDMVEVDLADDLRAKVAETSAGAASSFIQKDDTVSTIVVCMRGSEGGVVPSRDEVEERLYEQEMAMLAQRYLTDLRRDSTIITR